MNPYLTSKSSGFVGAIKSLKLKSASYIKMIDIREKKKKERNKDMQDYFKLRQRVVLATKTLKPLMTLLLFVRGGRPKILYISLNQNLITSTFVLCKFI